MAGGQRHDGVRVSAPPRSGDADAAAAKISQVRARRIALMFGDHDHAMDSKAAIAAREQLEELERDLIVESTADDRKRDRLLRELESSLAREAELRALHRQGP